MLLTDQSLRGRVSVVTGASRGIGAGIAYKLASAGSDLLLCSRRDSEELRLLQSTISNDFDVHVEVVTGDIAESAVTSDIARSCHKRFGRIDILVNNAGVMEDSLVGMITDESIANTFTVNVFAVIRLIQSCSRLMSKGNSGSIINIASVMGLDGNRAQTVYAASKAAVVGLTKSTAKELAPLGIRVNAIAPGLIDTQLLKSVPVAVVEQKLSAISLGRIGCIDDVANAALYLASDMSSYVTGQVLRVDGLMSS